MKIKDRAKPKIPPVEPGVYIAICTGVIDLGEQYSEKYKTYSNKIRFVWELAGETIEVAGKQEPRQLSKDFTVSASRKGNLRSFLSSWNGVNYTDDEFAELEMFDQIGRACQLQVVLNDTKEYANVDNIMALPKGVPAPTSATPPIRWDMDHWDDDVFAGLPQWAQEQIKKSTQYQKDHTPNDVIQAQPGPQKEDCPI